MEPVLNILGKTLLDPEGFYRASVEKLEEPLNDLRALRKEYQEAEAECQKLQQYYDFKKHQYESLKASWDKMWARLKDWAPDDESASESEQE
jgi:chromosome segregation ATPase